MASFLRTEFLGPTLPSVVVALFSVVGNFSLDDTTSTTVELGAFFVDWTVGLEVTPSCFSCFVSGLTGDLAGLPVVSAGTKLTKVVGRVVGSLENEVAVSVAERAAPAEVAEESDVKVELTSDIADELRED